MKVEVHLIGYTWIEGRPLLRLRDPLGDGKVINYPIEDSIHITVLKKGLCIGYNNGERSVGCPTFSVIKKGKSCASCQARDQFRPCMTCDGYRCHRLPAGLRAKCEEATNHLYMACFGEPKIKIGTCSAGRRPQRVIEQGPLAAAFIATGPKPMIKQIETTLCRAGHPFTETMRRKKKTQLLQSTMSLQQARALINEQSAVVRSLLPAFLRGIVYPARHVLMPPMAMSSRGQFVTELSVVEGTTLSGKVVGAVGHTLLIVDDGGRFAIDLGELTGCMLSFDRTLNQKKPSVQLGLFG